MSESSGKSGWVSPDPSFGATPQMSPSLCSPQSAMTHGCKGKHQQKLQKVEHGDSDFPRRSRDAYCGELRLMNSKSDAHFSRKRTTTGASSLVSVDSSIFTIPKPFNTCPKTTCFPSKCGVATVVMKNWEPLVFGPALAMLSRPTLSCCTERQDNRKCDDQNRRNEKTEHYCSIHKKLFAFLLNCLQRRYS